jgi:hypothetical protein
MIKSGYISIMHKKIDLSSEFLQQFIYNIKMKNRLPDMIVGFTDLLNNAFQNPAIDADPVRPSHPSPTLHSHPFPVLQ